MANLANLVVVLVVGVAIVLVLVLVLVRRRAVRHRRPHLLRDHHHHRVVLHRPTVDEFLPYDHNFGVGTIRQHSLQRLMKVKVIAGGHQI